jgi:hypothetical protein
MRAEKILGPVVPEWAVLVSTSMLPSAPSSRKTHSRPLARLAAVATLAAFLVAQSWFVCAPLCLLEGHAKFAAAASQYQDHLVHCHSGKVMPAELPAAQSLGSMLPVQVSPLVPVTRVVPVRFAPPAALYLQQIPPTEPPPPRSV